MKPSKIAVLGFKFHGGDVEGCLFALYPSNLQDTLVMITDAKKFLSDTGSEWAEMTMRSKDGEQEIVKLYKEQNSTDASKKVSDVVQPVPVKTVEVDPYIWSNYN